MKIALHNFYHLPQLISRGGIHNYVLELIKQGRINYLFFDDNSFNNIYGIPITATIDCIRSLYSLKDLGLDKTEIIFSSKVLNNKANVLLNFNGVIDNDMVASVKNFNGLKIFHVQDFFWLQPGSQKYKKLKNLGVDYLMSFSSSDKYSSYFQQTFPDYIGKVIPVPFGFAPRFKSLTPFEKRLQKCVALGSVLPTRRHEEPKYYWIEQANFYKKEKWLHKFRRMLVENKKYLSPVMDSKLPVYPQLTDYSFDIVRTFNDYQMFYSCETIYYFPSAKTFEGPAAGCALVCSSHPLYSYLGFKDGVNCIKHKEYDIKDFKEKIEFYQKHQDKLKKIQENGTKFVRENFSHAEIANNLFNTIQKIYNRWEKNPADQLAANPKLCLDFTKTWINPYTRHSNSSRNSQPISVKLKNNLIISLAIIVSFLHIKILGPLWSFIFTRIENKGYFKKKLISRFLNKPLKEKLKITYNLTESIRYFFLSWCPIPVRLPFGKLMLTYWDINGINIRKGGYEADCSSFVEKYLKPEMVVFDIGAHNGYYSLLSSVKVGKRGLVIAFEPSLRERKRLKTNIFLNFIKNIKVEKSAIGSYTGTTEFFVRNDKQTGCNSIKYHPDGVNPTEVLVPITTIDRYLQNYPNREPDFINIDAEGVEPEILKGAKKLLQRKKRPVFLIELTKDQGTEVFRLLKKKGYNLYFVRKGGKLLPANLQKAYGTNLVAIPETSDNFSLSARLFESSSA